MAIRATENRTTGFTANMMMLGREIVTPLELITGVGKDNSASSTPVEHVQKLTRRLQEVHVFARENIGLTQRHQKRTYDLKLAQRTFQVGDLVYRLDSASSAGESRKLKPVYVGPLIVSEVISPLLYRLEGRQRSQVLHHDRLRYCADRSIPMWVRRKRHEILDLDSTLPYSHDELEKSMDKAPSDVLPPVGQPPVEDVENLDVTLPFTGGAGSLESTLTLPGPDDLEPLDSDQAIKLEPEVEAGLLRPSEPTPRFTSRGRRIRLPGYLKEYEL